MHIFQNTYILIATLAIGVVILVSIGICFALRGVKAVNDRSEKSFTTISKMERRFKTFGKSILYLNDTTSCEAIRYQ